MNRLQDSKPKTFLLLKGAKSNTTEQLRLGSTANEFFSCSNTIWDMNEAAVELDLAVHVEFTSCKRAAGQFLLIASFSVAKFFWEAEGETTVLHSLVMKMCLLNMVGTDPIR